ncbi:MAG: type II toxin-antitoxin system RelE/ParE family toxin [Cyanobacteriota bacterium]
MRHFYLTRRAFLDIQKIYAYTTEHWGDAQAESYVSKFYEDFQKIADNIDLGKRRQERSDPFLMYPSGKHYIVYEPYKDGIIIITILHQMRNIETILQEFGSIFCNEIEALKKQIIQDDVD